MSADAQVTGHYGRPGMLEAILGAAEKAGIDPETMTQADLSLVDEFHLGGVAATRCWRCWTRRRVPGCSTSAPASAVPPGSPRPSAGAG